MSVKIMGQVYDADLPRNEKSILLAYADHADHEGGNVYPSVGRVAWKTGYDERQVQRITKSLIKKKILIPDGQGKNRTNRYKIEVKNLPSRPDYNPRQNVTLDEMSPLPENEGGKMSPNDVVNVTLEGGKMSPESSINRHLESKSVAKKPQCAPAKLDGLTVVPAYKVFVEVTKKHCLSGTQIEAIKETVGNKEESLEKWKKVVTAWALAGHKPTNITGMLDWFRDGIPQYNPKNGKVETPKRMRITAI